MPKKLTYEYVRNYFKEQGCELIEKEYINNYTQIKYKCDCGNISKIKFYSFKIGHRCMKCSSINRSGEKSGKWNPNLTEEDRIKNKTRTSDLEYVQWRINIYKKDNYTCQKCGRKGNILNAHHITNYATNKELRLNKDNGITLCKKHHKKFHSIYGRKNNTKQQLKEFLKNL